MDNKASEISDSRLAVGKKAARPKAVGTRTERSSQRVKTKTQKEQLVVDRHRQITRAAILVFQAKGFHGATVRDIGNAADLTQGTIYNYVQSKEDILFLACDHIVTDYQESLRLAFRKNSDSIEGLRLGLRKIVKTMYEHRVEIGLMYRELKHLSGGAQREIIGRIEQYMGEIEKVIAEALPAGHKYNLRFASNMTTFLPSVFGLREWATPAAMSSKAMIDQMTHFICAGLGLPAK